MRGPEGLTRDAPEERDLVRERLVTGRRVGVEVEVGRGVAREAAAWSALGERPGRLLGCLTVQRRDAHQQRHRAAGGVGGGPVPHHRQQRAWRHGVAPRRGGGTAGQHRDVALRLDGRHDRHLAGRADHRDVVGRQAEHAAGRVPQDRREQPQRRSRRAAPHRTGEPVERDLRDDRRDAWTRISGAHRRRHQAESNPGRSAAHGAAARLGMPSRLRHRRGGAASSIADDPPGHPATAVPNVTVVEVGFEPTRALPPYRISSAAH